MHGLGEWGVGGGGWVVVSEFFDNETIFLGGGEGVRGYFSLNGQGILI